MAISYKRLWKLLIVREMKKIIIPIVTGVVAAVVGAALFIGKLRGKKKDK